MTDLDVDAYMTAHLEDGAHERCIVCRLWERLQIRAEGWAAFHDYVRRRHDQSGVEWDQDFMDSIVEAIRSCEGSHAG